MSKLKEFNTNIYNFTSVFNNNKIVEICDKSIQILDMDRVALWIYKAQLRYLLYLLYLQYNIITEQNNLKKNSLDYIIVPGDSKYYTYFNRFIS